MVAVKRVGSLFDADSHRVVVVHLPRRHGRTRKRGIAHVVVEHDDARGAESLAHKALHFGIIDRLDFFRIVEIPDLGWRLREGESVAVEREPVLAAPRVFDPCVSARDNDPLSAFKCDPTRMSNSSARSREYKPY